MLGAYVCRQCRTQIARRIAPVRSPQWQPRATFLTLSSRKPPDKTGPSHDKAQASAQAQSESAQEGSHAYDVPRVRYTALGEQEPRTGRYSKHVRDDTDSAPTYTDNNHGPRAPAEPAGLEAGPAQRIEQALTKRRVDEAWQLFEESYTSRDCKALTEPSTSDVELLDGGKIFAHLLHSVNAAFCRGSTALAVTPTAALFRYEELGIARPEYWVRSTLARLTHQVIQAVNATSDRPQRDLPSLLHELLSVWRLFFQRMGMKSGPMASVSTDWQLPAIDALPDLHESGDFCMRLQHYHPKHVGNPELGFCAVYLYSISDALNSVESIKQQAAPFQRFLGRLLAGSHVTSIFKYTTASRTFSELPAKIQAQITMEIDAAPKKAMAMLGSTGETLDAKDTSDAATNLENFHLKQIARAVLSKSSPVALDRLWKQIESTYTSESNASTIPPRIYNAFLSGYLVLFSSQRSVEVWNHMIAHGVKPDLQSWVALLEGCAKAKDLNGFNAMWQRMLSTGVEPDNYAWTTRVNGLISLRQINQGLVALDDMGKRWMSAETAVKTPQTHGKGKKGSMKLPSSKAVNNCTKPSIEVINGAITALVQIRPESMRHEERIKYVQKILSWASNFQIVPNAIIYNSLIQLYLRARDSATAFKILSQMERDGLEGDMATHTMLITAAFDNQKFDGLTEAQRTERILKIFDDLEASGMRLNDHVYSAAIDRLLKQYANYSAVRTLIEHMQARKFVVSPQVYTSLITHYFQSNPPNITAVDGLVHQIFTSPRVPSDRILFDRLIEGYASHAEVGKMMSVLTRMSKQGKLPGWSALTAVVRALVEDQDYDRARNVVRDVERGEGVAQGGIMGNRQGELAFWGVVKGFGMGLEESRMGEFMQGVGGGGGGAEQMSGQEFGGVQYEQEAGGIRYDRKPGSVQYEQEHETLQYGRAPPAVEYAREPAAMEYSRDNKDVGFARELGSVGEEEDVHGFLMDEAENEQRRARRP
ncbi:hypothetical protein EJ02DRAFT_453866 [Clathrospora elynae]|uniref:Pentacotripeptide-repeat region of PRORP domain-containing protein n=1 Tax=Clathrospora elynae TaxID=706981 RepID=A0A6A5ST06_9PLEO|nr:hypothetical protein EJ02DRAFT_453866 [Clathrospora elynae]